MLYLFDNIRHKDILDNVNDKNYEEAVKGLVNFAVSHGIEGNIWQKFIIYTFIHNENPYSKFLEKNNVEGKLSFADDDLKEFYELYNKSFDIRVNYFVLKDSNPGYQGRLINSIYDLINQNNTYENFKQCILDIYRLHGLGDMAIYKAFRVVDGVIVPIKNVIDNTFDDIIGYDYQKRLLRENTEYFLDGRPYNNVLLYGESGTGKSTSIKALLNTYFSKGLRIIEIYKHQMEEISRLINTLKKRPYHYIIYMDDLSFEENEIEYKYLKSIIEGGIDEKPSNVAIYATSNRRHLINEPVDDNGTKFTNDTYHNETQAERLSLAYRFGLQIYFGSLGENEYFDMVKQLAKKNNLVIDEDRLIMEANKWQDTYGSLSGRCAQQFIKYISNKIKDNE